MSLTDLVYIEKGLAASRPATPPGKRWGWYATDTDTLSIWDGSAWHDVGGGSPTGAAGGVLSGTYPDPGFAADMATQAELDAHTGDTSDAHDASAISIADSGGYFSGSDVEAALQEIGAGSVGGGGGGIGASELIYRYTVSGSDKASIDTGSDTADAGSNVWSNGDVLEVFFMHRTDDAGAIANPTMIVNNDASALYDRQTIRGNNASAVAAAGLASTSWLWNAHGSGGTGSYASMIEVVIPGYAGTTFFKTGRMQQSVSDATAGNNYSEIWGLGYRSTSAITRLKVAAGGSAKFKVGSQFLVYRRLAS